MKGPGFMLSPWEEHGMGRNVEAAPRRIIAAVLLVIGLCAGAAGAGAADAIRIGDISSYTTLPAFTQPYRKGWQLALEQINAAGGVNGRPLEVVSRDDNGKPGDAITAANELVEQQRVVLLMGGFFSNIGLALADYAKQHQVLYLAAEPLTDALIWQKGNRYTFRLRPPNYAQVKALVEEAAGLSAKKWATIAPNYEYGQSAVAAFKALMPKANAGVSWVGEQWPAQGKLDAGATVQALASYDPQGIFNVTFGGDLAKFVREGQTRGLFQGREIVSMLTGEPEYLDPLGADAPKGWLVTGYPWEQITTPEHQKFVKDYQARFGETPRLGSLVGYMTLQAVAAILARTHSLDTDALVAAAEATSFASPLGEIAFRAADHQSTMGVFVGRTDVKDGKGIMVDWKYVSGDDLLPPPAEAAKLRPAG
jgi:branched-chain amino acid transport system substrate-binding protein